MEKSFTEHSPFSPKRVPKISLIICRASKNWNGTVMEEVLNNCSDMWLFSQGSNAFDLFQFRVPEWLSPTGILSWPVLVCCPATWTWVSRSHSKLLHTSENQIRKKTFFLNFIIKKNNKTLKQFNFEKTMTIFKRPVKTVQTHMRKNNRELSLTLTTQISNCYFLSENQKLSNIPIVIKHGQWWWPWWWWWWWYKIQMKNHCFR